MKNSLLHKINFLLNKKQKFFTLLIFILLLTSIILEFIGVSLIVPLTSGFITDNNQPKTGVLYDVLNLIFGFYISSWSNISEVLTLFVVFNIIKGLFSLFNVYMQSKYSQELTTNLSLELFKIYLNQSYIFHLRNNSAKLLKNIQSEVNQFNYLISSMILLISEICITLGIIVSLLLYDTIVISGLLSFFTLFSLIFYFLTRKKLLSWGEERQIIDEKINVNLLQSLGGIKEIIQYGKSLFFEKIHTKLIDKKAKINIWTLFLQQIPRYFLEIIFLLGIFLLYIYISNTENLIKFTSLLGILTFSAFRFLPSINKIISSIVGIKFSLPAANILFHEFSNINYKIISNNICPKINFKNIIELENITFAYNLESNEVINIQKLTINKGDIIGFHGQSGSGKSTLLDIIMGVLQPTTGKVSVDGIDISNNLKEWHKLIGYVPQSVFLLDDTIKKNVAFGLNDNEIDEYRVIKSLEYAELGDYKNIFPQGLNTMVGERGVGISGGQVQRIAIARALYINPEILVFDEFTSSLDKNTEQSIIGTIKKIANDKTIFIISHNLLPLTICDKVYEIQNGLIK